MSNIIIGGPTQFTNKIVASPTGQNRITIAPRPADVAFTAVRYGSALTDYTTAAGNDTIDDVPGPGFSSRLYLGFTEPFNAVRVKVATPENNITVEWRYATSVGTSLVSNIQETVSGLTDMATTTEGIVYWDMPNNWVQSYLINNGQTYGEPFLYWMNLRATDESPVSITRILKSTPP